VVDLVFQGLGQQFVGFDPVLFAVAVAGFYGNRFGSGYLAHVAGNAQAAFLNPSIPISAYDLRIDQYQFFPVRNPDDRYLKGHTDLRGGKANAISRRQGFQHIVNEFAY
jgi:hypothetical protein